MLRGQGGLAGGGIYFAESPAEARRKANQRGAMLKATVRVGRMKVVQRQGSTTFTQLVSEGYDSVKSPTSAEFKPGACTALAPGTDFSPPPLQACSLQRLSAWVLTFKRAA
ncbi:unnamed protein product [Effrenium voratum]|nr:unnamed protein product [Effrenium voratum]